MNKQTAVVALAMIIKLSKELDAIVNLSQYDRIKEFMNLLPNIERLCNGLVSYVSKGVSRDFINDIRRINSTDKIRTANNHHLFPGRFHDIINKYIISIDKLRGTADVLSINVKKTSHYPHLIDYFSNEKAKRLFDIARDAGYLANDYTLSRTISPQQVKVLTYGIGKQLVGDHRFPWKRFEEQFGITWRIVSVRLPEEHNECFIGIESLFPNVDFSQLTIPSRDELFTVPYEEKRVADLFLTLITHSYIDKRTKYEDFQAIFGFKKKSDFIPVNWIRSQRRLAYFADVVLRKTNDRLWHKVKNCFAVNGQPANEGGMLSTLSYLRRSCVMDTYDPLIKAIGEEFNHQ